MRTVFFGFLVFLLWATFARYYYVCEIRNLCFDMTEQVDSRPQTLDLTFGEEIILEGYEQFKFAEGDRLHLLSTNNKVFLDSVAAILKKQPERSLTITGAFLEIEKDIPLKGTFQENLGLARAESVRKYLVFEKGIDEKRIGLDYYEAPGDRLIEPVKFSLYPTAVDEENPEEYAKVQFTFLDMTYSDANFEVDSDVFSPGSAFKLYADSVVTYLQTRKEMRLSIIGHTDSDGNNLYNENLGMRRANSARQYFKQKGIKSEIKILSKGEVEPVAPNDSPANKQKNRRVNFIIE